MAAEAHRGSLSPFASHDVHESQPVVPQAQPTSGASTGSMHEHPVQITCKDSSADTVRISTVISCCKLCQGFMSSLPLLPVPEALSTSGRLQASCQIARTGQSILAPLQQVPCAEFALRCQGFSYGKRFPSCLDSWDLSISRHPFRFSCRQRSTKSSTEQLTGILCVGLF